MADTERVYRPDLHYPLEAGLDEAFRRSGMKRLLPLAEIEYREAMIEAGINGDNPTKLDDMEKVRDQFPRIDRILASRQLYTYEGWQAVINERG